MRIRKRYRQGHRLAGLFTEPPSWWTFSLFVCTSTLLATVGVVSAQRGEGDVREFMVAIAFALAAGVQWRRLRRSEKRDGADRAS